MRRSYQTPTCPNSWDIIFNEENSPSSPAGRLPRCRNEIYRLPCYKGLDPNGLKREDYLLTQAAMMKIRAHHLAGSVAAVAWTGQR